MTQANKRRPATPKQAAKTKGDIDRQLDAGLFKALGDPTRLLLVSCLSKCGRPCSVGEVAECCSVDLSVVSRHLAVLARAGLLDVRKEGRTVFYVMRYKETASHLRALASAIDACCPSGSSAATACGCI